MIARALRIGAAAGSAGAALGGVAYSVYLSAVGSAAEVSLRQRDEVAEQSGRIRFRLLIPAHNEEVLIKDTVAAVQDLDYPAELFEVHVVADNCTDRTAEFARAAGAQVHERTAPEAPGKGPALRWLLDSLPHGGRDDVVIIIDADTIVDSALLNAFAEKFEDGAVAVQGHYAVRDETAGGEVSLRSAAFAVRHLVRPAGRVRLGGSSSLYGNGMAFTEAIARQFPWSAHLTEDLDMGLRLLLAGHRVDFAPDALVRGEMPETLDTATTQHERWEAGRRSVATAYLPRLLGAARRKAHDRRWPYVDAAIDISMPPFGSLVAGTAAGTLGLGMFARGAVRRYGVGAGVVSLGMLGWHVVTSLRLAKAPPEVYRSLLRAPSNILWKLGVVAGTLRDRPADWVRTSRNDEESRSVEASA